MWICEIKDACLEALQGVPALPFPVEEGGAHRAQKPPSQGLCGCALAQGGLATPFFGPFHRRGSGGLERSSHVPKATQLQLIGTQGGPPSCCSRALGTLTSLFLCECSALIRVACDSSLRSSGLGGTWVRRGTRPRSPSW